MTGLDMLIVTGAIAVFLLLVAILTDRGIYGRILKDHEVPDISDWELNPINQKLISGIKTGQYVSCLGTRSFFWKWHLVDWEGKPRGGLILRWSKAHKKIEKRYNELKWTEIS